MDRKDFLGVMPMATLVGLGEERRPDRILSPTEEQFIGVYKLISSGRSGANPIGRIYYDRAGRMGAMLHPATREALPEPPTVEGYREMLRGLVAYFGTYTVEESTKRVFHHLEGSLNPREIGGNRVRWYEFVGNRLHLKTREDAPTPLIWERLPEG